MAVAGKMYSRYNYQLTGGSTSATVVIRIQLYALNLFIHHIKYTNG